MQYKTQLKEVKKEPRMLSLLGVQIMWKLFIRNLKVSVSLRKQPTFGDATTGFPAKWRLRNDLGSASDWLSKFPSRHDKSEVLPRPG